VQIIIRQGQTRKKMLYLQTKVITIKNLRNSNWHKKMLTVPVCYMLHAKCIKIYLRLIKLLRFISKSFLRECSQWKTATFRYYCSLSLSGSGMKITIITGSCTCFH